MAESVKTFQAHLTAVMDSLIRASVCEITKLFQDTVNDYLVEISLNRKENEALKLRLRLTENKLRNERKYGIGWAASRRAAGLLGADDTVRKMRRMDHQRGSQGKEWSAESWEEGTGGVSDEKRDAVGAHSPAAGGGGGGGGSAQEADKMGVSMEMKELADIKEEVEAYKSDSLRLLQEALQINQSETSPQTSTSSQDELAPAFIGADSGAEVWENPPADEPMTSGDELSGLETALKAEREREKAESGLGSPPQKVCGADSVAFIGLDGLCSSQQATSSSSQRDESTDMLPSGPVNKEEDEDSGEESGDILQFCPRCGGGFNSASDLSTHSCPVVEDQSHQCTVCGRVFSHSWSLKNHECVQAGEHPHYCELCGKSFTHSRSLERHQLVHTGERPHRCLQCGRSFSRLGNLERHRRIHTGERPYECGVCGKRFSRIEYLKRHQHVHIGEAVVKTSSTENSNHCSLCNQTFSDTEQLKQHPCQYNI